MGELLKFKRCESLEEVMQQAARENPDADDGIVITFDKDGAMTCYYHTDGLRMAYAAARLSFVAARDN